MITVQEAKDYLQVPDDESDDLIAELIQRAVADIERATGRRYGEPEETDPPEYLNGTGIRQMRISQKPEDTPAIEVERETSAGVWEVVPSTDYQVIGATLVHDAGWCLGISNYRATYTRGFSVGSLDPEYIQAKKTVLDQVQRLWNESDSGGLKSESIGPYSYTASGDSSSSGGSVALPDSIHLLRGWVYA